MPIDGGMQRFVTTQRVPERPLAVVPGTMSRLAVGARAGVALVLNRAGSTLGSPEVLRSLSEISTMGRGLVQASMSTAQQANEQRQRVLEVLRRERQIAQAAAEISAGSRAVSLQTVAVAEAIDAGNVTIESTNQSMTEMVATVAAGAELMQHFVARMAEVNKIVREIADIARQTNLLALNAAIEAAHAGKEGDGFSVIAQEIRALADRASGSTTAIEEKIGRMNEGAQSAAGAMQVGRDAAGVSIAENAKVQASLKDIRAAMHEVQRISAEVAEASEQQIVAGRAVTESVTQVDEMAARSSIESDAAAEMSIRLVVDAENVLNRVRGTRAGGSGRRATDRILEQVGQQQAEMLATLTSLRERCAGEARVSGRIQLGQTTVPGLHFGSIPATGATAWVDRISSEGRCGATVFVAEGTDFLRAATSVKLLDGTRATGTRLNPRGLAIAALRQGKSYFGAVYVLGNPYVAAYEPVLSAGGQVIGALYVGRPLIWKNDASG